MTRSGSISIEPHSDPELFLRHNHQLMQNDPPVIADLPRENPLFDDPPEPQKQVHGELLTAQQMMLCDYTLPTLDVV